MDIGTTPTNIGIRVGQSVDNAWAGWDRLDTYARMWWRYFRIEDRPLGAASLTLTSRQQAGTNVTPKKCHAAEHVSRLIERSNEAVNCVLEINNTWT